MALLKDDERLKNERARALKAKERFAQSQGGFSSKDVDRVGGGSGGTTPTLQPAGEFDSSGAFAAGATGGAEPGVAGGVAGGGGGVAGGGGSGPHRQRTLSEIEAARPQTAGEEELQLQLALAISKEEADDEEKKKRADDLRLDMAIAESRHGDEKEGPVPAASAAGGAEAASPAGPNQLLDLSLGAGGGAAAASAAPLNDPWSSAPAEKKSDDWLAGATVTASSSDPWGLPPPAPAAELTAIDPWGSPAAAAAPSPPKQPAAAGSRTTSPWGEPISGVRSVSPAVAAAATTIAINGKSSPWESQTGGAASSSDLFDLSGLEPALNEKPLSQTAGSGQGSPAHAAAGKPKRSPEDFLGANSALVNLDALVAGAKKAENANDNNPFAVSGAAPAVPAVPAATANPFLTPSAKGVPLNQMKAQTAWGDMGGVPTQPVAGPLPFPPPASTLSQAPPPFVGSTPLVPFASSTSTTAGASGKSSPFTAASGATATSFGAAGTDGGGNPFLL